MQLEELRWFVVLAETEHVTEAAAELGVSQPALSRALARFERQAGTPLFDRVHRRLRLNAYGQVMLEHARRSLAELQSATERIADMRDPDTGRVRLAFLHSLASWYVPEQLRCFREAVPGMRFELFQGPAHELVDRVRSGRADLAITAPRPDGPEFSWHRLYVERLCLAVPSGHRFASRARVRLAVARDEPFVALEEPFGLRLLGNQLWAEEGMAPDIVFEATEIPTMEGLVAAGFGVAVVPVPRDGGRAGVEYVPLANASAKREVGLIWARDRELPPPGRRFAQFLRSTGNDVQRA